MTVSDPGRRHRLHDERRSRVLLAILEIICAIKRTVRSFNIYLIHDLEFSPVIHNQAAHDCGEAYTPQKKLRGWRIAKVTGSLTLI